MVPLIHFAPQLTNFELFNQKQFDMEVQNEILQERKHTGFADQSNGQSKAYHVNTIVIGGGQAGLVVGYYLARQKIPFLILDASKHTGDTWRSRWDSLRLFTTSRYNHLPGMKFPAPTHHFPTKDEMGDFLERYAKHFSLPIRHNTRVDCLFKENEKFVLVSNGNRFEADNVVVAMATYQKPKIPDFAHELDSKTFQMHSATYKNPGQLRDGDVLLVGGGNTGSELAMELSKSRKVWMSGRFTGHIPFRIAGMFGRTLMAPLVLKFLYHRVFTIKNPIGRLLRSKVLTIGGPLVRVHPSDLRRAGVSFVPKTKGSQNGKPVLEDGRVIDVPNVIWCTGFHNGFSWINLPVLGSAEPLHNGGVVDSQPGLYFVGLHFLHALSSGLILGVGRDARRIVAKIKARIKRAAA